MHTAFAGELRWAGVPEVHVGPYFWAPLIRDGDDRLLAAARAEAEAWAADRVLTAQPWWRPSLKWSDPAEYQRRMRAWDKLESMRKPFRPGRRLALPLFAAYARDVAGLDTDWAIGDSLGMTGSVDALRKRERLETRARKAIPRDRSRPVVQPRFRGIDAVITRGRRLAAGLGAWPWTEFEDGALPDGWWASTTPVLRAAERGPLDTERRPFPVHARNVCVALSLCRPPSPSRNSLLPDLTSVLPVVTLIIGAAAGYLADARRDVRLASREAVAAQLVAEREEKATDRARDRERDAFQRETLLELQDWLGKLARAAGAIYALDAQQMIETGRWGRDPTSEQWSDASREAVANVQRYRRK